MTTPDRHPYLTEGDLRTAEDVLEWLDAGLRPPDGPLRLVGAWKFRHDLAERLDRERRQACRRGALRTFRHLAWYARVVRRGREAWELDDPEFSAELAWENAVDCLAFRAAARAR
jgi:hypothetical protein